MSANTDKTQGISEKNRECPHCHEHVSLYKLVMPQCMNFKYYVKCNHCKEIIRVKNPIPSPVLPAAVSIACLLVTLGRIALEDLFGVEIDFLSTIFFFVFICFILNLGIMFYYRNRHFELVRPDEE